MNERAGDDGHAADVAAAEAPWPAGKPSVGLTGAGLRDAVRFLNDRVATGASVAEVAAAVRLSPFHFARLFKQSVGLGPHQYLVRLRVQRAKRMLAAGAGTGPADPAPLARLAFACGFADQSHLCRQFKRLTGQTPAGYARRVRADRRPQSSSRSALT